MNAPAVLLVDDEPDFRENVAAYLTGHGYRIVQADGFESALEAAREREFDAALIDVMMPGTQGVDLLDRLKALDAQLEVVVITGFGSIEGAIDAMRHGAFHFVTKPARLAELELLLERAVEKGRLARQNQLYREELRDRRGTEAPRMVAHSASMRRLLEEAVRLAGTDSSVLLEGETGTGKDLLARLIHATSPRGTHSLVVVDCGALPGDLLDSELFGQEKGAFTGAEEGRPGLLEVADAGTLFLDEIGELSPAVQVRLLRFLEKRVVRRLGSTRERRLDVRVLAATHRDLSADVATGRFREDLFHRLVVFRLKIPPLRGRPEDILPLAEHFVTLGATQTAPAWPLGESARAALLSYEWPGNVRELAHTMERARLSAAMTQAAAIEPRHLGLPAPAAASAGALVGLEEAETRHMRAVLEQVGGNRKEAAQILGVSERQLYRLLKGSRTTT